MPGKLAQSLINTIDAIDADEITTTLKSALIPTRPGYENDKVLSNSITQIFHSKLRAIIPNELGSMVSINFQTMDQQPVFGALTPYIGLMVYFVTNNLLSVDTEEAMFKIFKNKRNSKMMRTLLSFQTPSIQCFKDKLFRGAIATQN